MAFKPPNIRKVFSWTHCWGLEAFLEASGQWTFHLIRVALQKEQINWTDRQENIQGVPALLEILPTNEPVAITFTGKGLATKKFEEKELSNPQLIGAVLPNARQKDFYLQRIDSEEGTLATIARKDQVDFLLEELAQNKIRINQIWLGGLVLANLKNLLNPEAKEMTIGIHQIWFADGIPKNYKRHRQAVNNDYRIGMEYLPAELMPALATGFSPFFPPMGIEELEHETLFASQQELFHKRLFNLGGISFLILIFGALLANFFINDHYTQQLETLGTQITNTENKVEEAKRMALEVEKKQALIHTYEIEERANTSFFADQIAASLPAKMTLTEMNVHPRTDSKKKEEKITFQQEVVSITGLTPGSLVLNNWVKELQGKSWVTDIELVDYTSDPKTFQNEFELHLELDHLSGNLANR